MTSSFFRWVRYWPEDEDITFPLASYPDLAVKTDTTYIMKIPKSIITKEEIVTYCQLQYSLRSN